MHIVYCIGSLANIGGVERVLVNKANYLSNLHDYQVTILVAHQGKCNIVYEVSDKVNIIDLKINETKGKFYFIPFFAFYSKLFSVRKIYNKVLSSLKPDIVISVERGFSDFIVHSLKPRIPNVRESHSSAEAVKYIDKNSELNIKKHYFTYLCKKQLLKFNEVVLLSDRDRKFRNLPNGKTVIPNAVSKFEIDSQYNLDSKRVISVGRLDQFKNFKDQILIWKKVVEVFPDWSLHIYGQGIEERNLQKLIIQEKLENNVFLEGKTNEIEKELQRSSFFIFTSLAEGFGMVLVEAMQMGLPVVSYDCACGPSEIITDGEDGFLVKLQDKESFLEKIYLLIENADLRKKMSVHATEKGKKFFPENIMPKWLLFFQEVVEKYG